MRTPSTVFRGVFVCITILGVFLLTNVNIAQSSDEANYQFPDLGTVEHQDVQLTQTEDQSSTNLFHIPFVNNQIIRLFNQGFDKCTPPSIEQMQIWWDSSPYSTINIYLGGISLICPYSQLGPDWFSQVDQMGWSFILTWAGPQAPKGCPDDCKFKYPISLDPAIAIQEGRTEAVAAVDAARSLGFNGPLVIYYDVESYSDVEEGDPSRVATAAFLQGWVEQLHDLDPRHKAGAYGASCTSYISDWAENVNPPDDIWIAYWNKDYQFDPNASVWNIPCVPNNLWADQQRLRQYTGGHRETWGDVELRIDSDVLFGEINTLDGIIVPEASLLNSENDFDQFVQNSTGEPMQMQMLSPDTGWALRGQRLHWTDDSGDSWRDITSDQQSEILGLNFLDTQKGWLVARIFFTDQSPILAVLYTSDGGNNWQEVSLPINSSAEAMQVESATVNLVDATSMWIALKLHSSSNFSIGKLFTSQDGGLTWQARSLPLGEPVRFIDENRGWVAGGPAGDQLFYTEDGGRTWRDQSLTLESSASTGQTTVGLPVFLDNGSGFLPVTIDNEHIFYGTDDNGESWNLSETMQLRLKPEQFEQVSSELALDLLNLNGTLPEGVIALDLLTDQYGWALVQDGTCTGYKLRAGETLQTGQKPLQCESNSRLLKTTNGGTSWSEITPPD